MRWILISLLLINSIYFLWQHQAQEERVANRVEFNNPVNGDDNNPLLLLSELPVGSDMAEVIQEPLGMVDAQTELLATADPVAKVVAVIAEPEASFRPDTGAITALAAPEVVVTCWLIGPFAEQDSGRQVINRLQALDLTVDLQSRVQAGKSDYWVYIPPQVTRKVAISLLRELQSNKIDSFLITDGELSRGLSLGFFTQQARAQAVHRERVAQGYDARIKIVPREYTEFWGVFDTRINGEFTDLLWEKVQSGNKELERHKNNCDTIASVDNLD